MLGRSTRMWKRLTSLKPWQQYLIGAAWVAPWFAPQLATSWLPESVRFATWPESLRALSVIAFILFVAVDVGVSYWFLFIRKDSDDINAAS